MSVDDCLSTLQLLLEFSLPAAADSGKESYHHTAVALLDESQQLAEHLLKEALNLHNAAAMFDVSPQCPGNGYRTMLVILNRCVHKLLTKFEGYSRHVSSVSIFKLASDVGSTLGAAVGTAEYIRSIDDYFHLLQLLAKLCAMSAGMVSAQLLQYRTKVTRLMHGLDSDGSHGLEGDCDSDERLANNLRLHDMSLFGDVAQVRSIQRTVGRWVL